MISLIVSLVLAAIFWFVIFGLKIFNFWLAMTAASGFLAIWSIVSSGTSSKQLFRFKLRYFFWGLLSAAALYFIFWAGRDLSLRLISFASGQIAAIYDNKSQLDAWKIAILLFFWIGPAEEIFWRGMVQRKLAGYFGANFGWIAGAFVYAIAHLWSGNLMLVMAALICGLFWGWLFRVSGSLWPGIVSHAVWDIITFLLFPL